MSDYRVHLTLKSRNGKTGPIPVSTTERKTCPNDCPLKGGPCYAEHGPIGMFWRKVTDGRAGISWDAFCVSVFALPLGTLWRHNQSGDLPGDGVRIDKTALGALVRANAGKRGFTYTHYSPKLKQNAAAIAHANKNGFTINLSGNTLAHADQLAALGIGPVTVVLPIDAAKNETLQTPQGRKVIPCPATYRDDVTCKSCGLCAIAARDFIVGFPAHGISKKKAERVAMGRAA
jgi:hypothetical protein